VAALAAAGGSLAVVKWRGGRVAHAAGPSVGRAIAAATTTLLRYAEWRHAARCLAGPDEPPDLVLVGDRTFGAGGGRLAGGKADRRVKLGFVADARGTDEATLANVKAARKLFEAAKVDAVISLGGQGATRADVAAVLGPLARDARWVVIAIPGDLEDLEAHRAAIEELRAAGAPIVDGAAARIVVIDGVAIAFLAGLPLAEDGRAHGLAAGLAGCGFTEEDAAALADRLAAEPGPRVVASYRPPRQRGGEATDVTPGGVHAGEDVVARVARRGNATLLVHGASRESAGRWAGAAPIVAATGALASAPVRLHGGGVDAGSVLVVEIDGERAEIKSLATTHSGARLHR
jgi:hypothetical protein